MNAPDVYRVIGVRRDKSRRVICRHVTVSQAQRMKTSLDSSMIFPSVEIEAEANVLDWTNHLMSASRLSPFDVMLNTPSSLRVK